MDLSLSGQTSLFNDVFFVFKSLLGIERQKKLKENSFLTRKPRSHVRILIYRTWPNRVMFVHVTFFVVKYFFFLLVSLLVSRFVLLSRNVLKFLLGHPYYI